MAAVGERAVQRLGTGFDELDRVLGGGLVPGSLVLVGGDPGIGKSTLLLQTAADLAQRQSVLYVSAEESAQQVKLRWQRLAAAGGGGDGPQLLAETDLEHVLQELEALRPDVAVIDSIQALHDADLSSAPGSVAQVRECAASLQRLAKKLDIALLLVGHVTKEGMLAGPKVLEHLVDAVLTFEGDRFASHRLLRAVKNRFGATHELGVFEMRDRGLLEVSNPSELFLGSPEGSVGMATIVAMPTDPSGLPKNSSLGLLTSSRPRSRISKTPSSWVAPKRFFTARSSRWLAKRSPSKVSTASTRCSSTLGPANIPSLVTWPTKSRAISSFLASRCSDAAHSRT